VTNDDLLAIWRSNLHEIEKRIAEYGGENRAPLELVNLLRNARREIASLEGEAYEEGMRSPSQQRMVSSVDYALVEIERLRGDLARWQASVTKDILEMTEQHVKPSEQIIYNLSKKLDDISAAVADINVKLAVMSNDLEKLRSDQLQVQQINRDIDRIKAVMGINGNGGLRHVFVWYWWIVAGSVLIVIQLIIVMLRL